LAWRWQVSANDPGDDRKRRDRSIDPAVDPIAEIAAVHVASETLLDLSSGVTVFQPYL